MGTTTTTQEQKSNQQFNTTGATSATSGFGQTASGSMTPTEDPLFAMFRDSLLPFLTKQLGAGRQTIYGQPEKAAFFQGQNQLANDATASLKQKLAGAGRLDSGAFDRGVTNIELGRMGNISNFQRDLPFMESQAQFQRMLPLLGLATSFAGRAPLGQVTTGASSGTSQQSGTSEQGGTSSGSMSGSTTTKTPLWQDILGGALGVVGQAAGNWGFNPTKWF